MKKTAIFLIVLLLCMFFVCGVQFWAVYPLKYKKQIVKYSAKYNIDSALVASVICAESRFDAKAKSASGACGLMQLLPSTFKWIMSATDLPSDDIFNPEANICAGCFYIRYLKDKYDDLVYVLACYNAGEGVVATWTTKDKLTIEEIKYPETQNYVKKVTKLIKLYSSRF